MNHPGNKPIIVVSGLPRSGTSMMMQMLQAGGLGILTDNIRKEDKNNQRGYLEYEGVKKLKYGDYDWLDQAKGKAVKIISSLLEYLPDSYEYKIIFMKREMGEILASQGQMLQSNGKPYQDSNNDRLALIYRKHLNQISIWLNNQPNMEVLNVDYNLTIDNSQLTSAKIASFLDTPLDISKMAQAVHKELYHQKNQKNC